MIAAYILSTGQSTFPLTYSSIYPQVDHIETIENERPVNKAINIAFTSARQIKADYFIILGADTVHKEGSIATMMKYMTDDLWCVMGRLEDYYRGTDSYGNHLYHTKNLGDYTVDEHDPLYDHTIHDHMDKLGFKKVVTDEIIGKHHPIWTCKEAFEKHLFSGRRYGEKDRKIFLKQVKKRYEDDPCDVNRAAVIGFEIGIDSKEKLNTLTHETTSEWEALAQAFNQEEKLIW